MLASAMIAHAPLDPLFHLETDDWQAYHAPEVFADIDDVSSATEVDDCQESRNVSWFEMSLQATLLQPQPQQAIPVGPEVAQPQQENQVKPAVAPAQSGGAANGNNYSIKSTTSSSRGKPTTRKPWSPAEEAVFHKALDRFGPFDVETDPITGRVSVRLGQVSLPLPTTIAARLFIP